MWDSCKSVAVQHVELAVKEPWFAEAMAAASDANVSAIVILAHMHVEDPLVHVILKAIRATYLRIFFFVKCFRATYLHPISIFFLLLPSTVFYSRPCPSSAPCTATHPRLGHISSKKEKNDSIWGATLTPNMRDGAGTKPSRSSSSQVTHTSEPTRPSTRGTKKKFKSTPCSDNT